MATAIQKSGYSSLSDLNTTPLIDVMLVLLVMFIITIPVATHSVDVQLPAGCDADCPELPAPDPVRNKIVVNHKGQTLWNGSPVSRVELATLLDATTRMTVEPELQFEPEASASYAAATRTLRQIEASDVTKFGFVGNEKYRQFSRPAG